MEYEIPILSRSSVVFRSMFSMIFRKICFTITGSPNKLYFNAVAAVFNLRLNRSLLRVENNFMVLLIVVCRLKLIFAPEWLKSMAETYEMLLTTFTRLFVDA